MLVTGQVKLMVGELTESYCVVVVKLPIIGGAENDDVGMVASNAGIRIIGQSARDNSEKRR